MDIDLKTLNAKQGFKVYGIDKIFSGTSISGNFDINSDNITDIIIGAPNASPLNRDNAGAGYVIYGRNNGYSEIDLNNFNSTIGFRIIGETLNDFSHKVVYSVGDFNNDDVSDLLISAPDSSPVSRINAGACYLVYGQKGGYSTDFDLSNFDRSNGFKILGAKDGDFIASESAGGFDINLDGISDIIVSGPSAYVILGQRGGYLDIDLGSTFDDSQGFQIIGEGNKTFSKAGDVNDDGVDDIIIGIPNTPLANRTSAGLSYVVYGVASPGPYSNIELAQWNNTLGFRVIGANINDESGNAVSGGCDINSDGVSDVIIGAPNASPFNRTSAGVSYVIYGKKGGSNDIDLNNFSATDGFRVFGATPGDQSGASVSRLGDVNGDNICDFGIGAPKATPLNRTSAGIIYVVFGKKGGYLDIDLAQNDAYVSKIIGANEDDSKNGIAIAAAGDVNKDGIADILIGLSNASPLNRSEAGESYVIYGSNVTTPTPTLTPTAVLPPSVYPITTYEVDLNTLDGTKGFKVIGANEDDYSGQAVSWLGDVNGDKIADFIIGAPLASPKNKLHAGESYIIYGKKGGYPKITLAHLEITQGFKILGAKEKDNSGYVVSAAEDINADGIADAIIGAPYASYNDRNQSGISYIVYGRIGGYHDNIDLGINNTYGFCIFGAKSNDHSGFAVSSVGDINKDGIADIVIGAPDATPLGRTKGGISYIVYGRIGGYPDNIDLNNLNSSVGFQILGESSNDHSGQAVSGGSDINKDGMGDIIISAPYASPDNRTNAGTIYIIYGRKYGYEQIDLSKLDEVEGFKIKGARNNDNCGIAVSTRFDINHDTIDDIIVGAPNASPIDRAKAGRCYIVYGRNDGYPEVDLLFFWDTEGFEVLGANFNDNTGYSVSGTRDINRDGIDDVIIDVPNALVLGRSKAGLTYVIYGKKSRDLAIDLRDFSTTEGFRIIGINGSTDGIQSNFRVSTALDINADGTNDILIGLPGADISDANTLGSGNNVGATGALSGTGESPVPPPLPPSDFDYVIKIILPISIALVSTIIGTVISFFLKKRLKKCCNSNIDPAALHLETHLPTYSAFGGELLPVHVKQMVHFFKNVDEKNVTIDNNTSILLQHTYDEGFDAISLYQSLLEKNDGVISLVLSHASQIISDNNGIVVLASDEPSSYQKDHCIVTARVNSATENRYTNAKAIVMHEFIHMVFDSIFGDVSQDVLSSVYKKTMEDMLSYASYLLGSAKTYTTFDEFIEDSKSSTVLDLFYMNSDVYNTVKHGCDEEVIKGLEELCGISVINSPWQTLEQREYRLLEQCMPKVVVAQNLNEEQIYFLERVADHINGIQRGVYSEGASGAEELVARCVEMRTAGVSEQVLGLCDAVWEIFQHVT